MSGIIRKKTGTNAWETVPDTGNGGSQAVLSRTTHLTAAALLDLHNTPVELIPDPGAGKLISVLKADLKVQFGTQAFGWVNQDGFDVDLQLVLGATGILNGAISPRPLDRTVDAVTSASTAFDPEGLDLSDYAQQPLNIQAVAPGLTAGPVVSSVKNQGGADYAPGDTGTILAGSSGTTTYEVDTVDGGGAVLTYHITTPGKSYEATDVPTQTDTGIGSGFTVDVTEVTMGDGDLYVTVIYAVEDVF